VLLRLVRLAAAAAELIQQHTPLALLPASSPSTTRTITSSSAGL
jgi:hypothetical protein